MITSLHRSKNALSKRHKVSFARAVLHHDNGPTSNQCIDDAWQVGCKQKKGAFVSAVRLLYDLLATCLASTAPSSPSLAARAREKNRGKKNTHTNNNNTEPLKPHASGVGHCKCRQEHTSGAREGEKGGGREKNTKKEETSSHAKHHRTFVL